MKIVSTITLISLGWKKQDARRVMQNLTDKVGKVFYKQHVLPRKPSLRGSEGTASIRYIDIDYAIGIYKKRITRHERPNARRHTIKYLHILEQLKELNET